VKLPNDCCCYTDGKAINSSRFSKIQHNCHLIATSADYVSLLYDEVFTKKKNRMVKNNKEGHTFCFPLDKTSVKTISLPPIRPKLFPKKIHMNTWLWKSKYKMCKILCTALGDFFFSWFVFHFPHDFFSPCTLLCSGVSESLSGLI